MRKYILILAVLVTAIAGAQIPGFQGKRFIVKYDLGIMHPAIVGRTGKPPMLYHGLALDYTVSRAWSIGVKGNFMTIKAPTERKGFYNYTTSSESKLDYKNYTGQYTQVTVGVYAKKFAIRKGYLAPMGRYIVLGVYYQYVVDNFAQIKISGDNSYYGNYNYTVARKKGIAHFGGVTVGMGRNFIVARRLVLDLGFTLNIAPVAHIVFDDKERATVYRDVMLRNLLQIHLGFGALAF